ncbi:MAG: hypothetical protein WCE62_20935 [Polyangiales bacterium]
MRRLLLILWLTGWPMAALAQDADTGADTDTDTETETGALPPKVAVVVAGDPDEILRDTATFIEGEAVMARLRVPSDPALRGAMRGDSSTDEDGLDGLRSIRRGLGFEPRKDLDSYRRIGVIAGADALVVVHREGDIVIEVFDVSAAQFYEGALQFDESSSAQRLKFIESRAKQAQLRWTEPAPPPPTASPKVNEPDKPADESRAKRRMKKAWPYVVAGALLLGGVTYLIIDQRRADDPGPPLLRFTPGAD